MTGSVWAEHPALPEFPPLRGDLKTDVLVIGGGLAGVLCAWKLGQAGVDCTLIEADRLCHGVTRNTTAKLTSQHGLIYDRLIRAFDTDRARLYWQANEWALEEYRRLARKLPCDLETKDHFVYTLDAPEKLERELTALQRMGAPAAFAPSLPLPFGTAGAVRFRDQAQFHPLKLAAGLVSGLKVYENTAAKEFLPNGVRTGRGLIRAEKIIVATHFPINNKHGGYFLKMYQQRSYVLGLEKGPDVAGMYLDEREGGLSLRNYGDLLLVGGGSHRTGKGPCGWEMLEDFAGRHYPASPVKYRWAAQDCMTLDGVPYIGRYGRRTGELYVATGFNKWGMTSAMAAAGVLCDLVRGRENPYEGLFDPARRMLRPQLFANGWEAAVSLLTPARPRCPHMGCALKWNPRERSWDCPCHGSRFGEKGQLLDGPATGDLRE